MSDAAEIIVRPHLFSDRDVEHFAAPSGFTVAELIAQLAGAERIAPEMVSHLRVYVSTGRELSPDEWEHYIPAPGVRLGISVVPAGANAKSIIGAVLLIVVSIFAPYAGAALSAAYFGGSVVAASVIAAGITVAASLAINAIFKPSTPTLGSGDNGPGAYLLRNQSNRATPYEPVLRVYGRMRIAPRVVGMPRSIIRGGYVILQAVYSCGYGPLQIEDARAGDTPLSAIQGAQIIVHENFVAGSPLSLYTQDTFVTTLNLQFVVNGAAFRATTPDGVTAATINISFPSGLQNQNPKGGARNYHTRIVFIARDVGAGGGFDQTLGAPVVNWSWQFLGVGLATAPDGNRYVEFVANTTRQLAASITLHFPTASTYEVMVWQAQAISMDGSSVDLCYWNDLQTYAGRPPINPAKPETIIELEVPAQEQAANTLQLFTVTATSKLYVIDGALNLQGPYPTRNPACIYLDMLMGTAAARPLPYSRINMLKLYQWEQACAATAVNAPEERFYCDVVIEQPTTLWEAIHIPLGCGRAAYAMHDSQHSVLLEDFAKLPAQLFTEANTRGATGQRAYLEPPHALKVLFIDPLADWQQREVVIYDAGYHAGNATKFESLTLNGVTRSTQAWRDGNYFFAEAKLRRETITLETDIENLACTRGDLVYVAHDVLQVGGAPAYVTAIISATKLSVGADFGTPAAGGITSLRVRKPDGIGPLVGITSVVAGDFTTAVPHGAEVGDLIVWGYTETVVGEYIVSAITAQADLAASLTLIEYAPALANADSGVIPPYVPELGGRPPQAFGPLAYLIATASYWWDGATPYAQTILTWQPLVGAVRYEVAVFEVDAYRSVASTTNNSFTFPPFDISGIPGATLTTTYRVTAINSYGARADATTALTINKVSHTKPGPVQDVTATPRLRDIQVRWTRDGQVTGYVVRYPDLPDAFVSTDEWFLPPQIIGTHVVEVAGRDALGQVGPYESASFTVLEPNRPSIAGNAHSNVAYLRWGSLVAGVGWIAETTHALDYFELAQEFIEPAAMYGRTPQSNARGMSDTPLRIKLREGVRLVGTKLP